MAGASLGYEPLKEHHGVVLKEGHGGVVNERHKESPIRKATIRQTHTHTQKKKQQKQKCHGIVPGVLLFCFFPSSQRFQAIHADLVFQVCISF